MARAEVVTGVAREIFDTMAWRYAEHVDSRELASLRQVMAEAEAHRVRMQSRSGAV